MVQTFYNVSSTTANGNMSFKWGEPAEVLRHRQVFLEANGLRLENGIALKTQDTDVINLVDRSFAGRGMFDVSTGVPADALITDKLNYYLFLLTADCLPISFCDPFKGVVGLAHLSWKTTNLKLVQKVIDVFVTKFKSSPDDLRIVIGPGIHKESYVLDDLSQKSDSDWLPYITQLSDGRLSVDIVGYNVQQLLDKGIALSQISVSSNDTQASKEYFSHYRSVKTGESEGRFATVVGIKSEQRLSQ